MEKQKLQALSQRLGWRLPVYRYEKDPLSPSHRPRFTATVILQDEITASSSSHFPTVKQAENAAADEALHLLDGKIGISLKEKCFPEALLKNKLQEYTQKANMELPVYSTVSVGTSMFPRFASSVAVGNSHYPGAEGKNKKTAESNAAKTALIALGLVNEAEEKPEPLQLPENMSRPPMADTPSVPGVTDSTSAQPVPVTSPLMNLTPRRRSRSPRNDLERGTEPLQRRAWTGMEPSVDFIPLSGSKTTAEPVIAASEVPHVRAVDSGSDPAPASKQSVGPIITEQVAAVVTESPATKSPTFLTEAVPKASLATAAGIVSPCQQLPSVDLMPTKADAINASIQPSCGSETPS